ncbi:MAG: hypothetical protein DWQ02_12230 [Bacteroidetes bacterium]|nr:MAG: hypothetical protein DWQ02_12230 [Bacteroidota bacterium]
MFIRQSQEQGFKCIDEDGNLLFTLPPGHDPTVRTVKEPFKLSNFYFVDFSENILPVTDGHRYYLINKKGEEVRDMGEGFNWISTLQEGYFRVFERFENRRNASVIVFYDKNGQPMFDGQKYWEASRFRNGHAVVQLSDKDGEWHMIDKEGKVVLNLSDTIPGNIRRIADFKRDAWQISVKNEQNYYTKYYLRTDGALSNKESDLWRYEKNGRPHYKKPAVPLNRDLQKRLNGLGDWVFPPRIEIEGQTFLLLNDGPKDSRDFISVVYNQNNEKIHLDTLPGVESISPLDFRGDMMIAQKITEEQDTSFVFYSLPEFNPGYETDKLSYKAKVEGNLLVYYDSNSLFAVKVSKIVNLQTGKTIYEPDANSKVFTSISEAMKHKESVTVLDLKNVSQEDLEKLKQFPKLKVLKMEKSNASEIPSGLFSTFNGLTALKIEDFQQIQKFPDDIRQLKSLRSLFISDCSKLQGVKGLISSFPALTELRSDLPFGNEEIKNLQEQYPKLRIHPVLKAVSID